MKVWWKYYQLLKPVIICDIIVPQFGLPYHKVYIWLFVNFSCKTGDNNKPSKYTRENDSLAGVSISTEKFEFHDNLIIVDMFQLPFLCFYVFFIDLYLYECSAINYFGQFNYIFKKWRIDINYTEVFYTWKLEPIKFWAALTCVFVSYTNNLWIKCNEMNSGWIY